MANPTDEDQARELPETSSSNITEDRGRFLGLPGYSFFFVFLFFIVMMMISNFPIALFSSMFIFAGVKIFVMGKPDNYLKYLVRYPFWRKVYEYKPKGKRGLK